MIPCGELERLWDKDLWYISRYYNMNSLKGTYNRISLVMGTNISEEYTVSIFRVAEGGGSMLL
jgi:hypothetical protein